MRITIETIHTYRFHLLIALASGCTLATGCVAPDGAELLDDAVVDPTRVDASKDESELPAAPIGQPMFYESDDNGDVVSGPIPDLLPESEAFKSAGSRPIHVQKYGPFGNGGTLSTGFPTSNWVAVVVGLDTTDGDINEVGSGNPLRAFPFQSNGIWHVTFDLRSHGDHESWSIWVMYIQRDMASTTNF